MPYQDFVRTSLCALALQVLTAPAAHTADVPNWSPLGAGLNGEVYALAVSGGTLYAGGSFTTAMNGDGTAVTVNNIAEWNGSGWSALGGGVSEEVEALAILGTNLYAAGPFTTATNGGNIAVKVNSIAQWNGSAWSPLGSELAFPTRAFVYALAASGGTLYMGGNFGTVGGSTVNHIAQWNGSSWSALGSGVNFPVLALAVSGTNLYAGGEFTTAGGTNANYVAQWDGSGWSPMGLGVDSRLEPYVLALAVSGTNLYAGGEFTTAGGNPANYIALWNGTSWSALGSGMNLSGVNALAVSGTNLYAGGSFTQAGGTNANYVAQWNGSSWSPLGSGLNGG